MSFVPIGSIVYEQPWDRTGFAYASQNDTNSLGAFATTYDNVTLLASTTITSVAWTGEYFNPPAQGQIQAFSLFFLDDNAGQPGSVLQKARFPGTANETFLGNFTGFPTYTYGVNNPPFTAQAGVKYWLAVVPDLGFPPQWGWATGTGGDGIAYQNFFGARSQIPNDLAFTLWGGGGGGGGGGQPGAFFKIQKLVVSVKQDNIPVRGRNK